MEVRQKALTGPWLNEEIIIEKNRKLTILLLTHFWKPLTAYAAFFFLHLRFWFGFGFGFGLWSSTQLLVLRFVYESSSCCSCNALHSINPSIFTCLVSIGGKWPISYPKERNSRRKLRRSSAVGACLAPSTKMPPISLIKPPIASSSPNHVFPLSSLLFLLLLLF